MKKVNKKELGIKKNIAQALELPKEVMLNLPLITLVGREQLSIENYMGIIEYSCEQIRLNTNCGALKIIGKNLFVKEITSENIEVYGTIFSLEYII